MADKQEDKWIEDIVGALCDPIIVYPAGGWEHDLPEELKKRIPLDRLAHNMACLNGKASRDECSDLEALLYLFPASMAAPMGENWTRIYLYLGLKVGGKAMEEAIGKEHSELDDYEMAELRRLKRWIQQRKVEARKTLPKGEQPKPETQAKQEAPKETAIAYKLF